MYRISLNRVHDKITVSESGDELALHVNSDPGRIVAGLANAQARLQALAAVETTEQEQRDAALAFAGAIFGTDQAKALLDFYHGDPGCVIGICGKYFNERLAKLVEKAQKRAK